MLINSYLTKNPNIYARTDGKNCTNKKMNPQSIQFKGHLGAEKYAKDGIVWLVHETALFRDKQTQNFVKKYIEQNFAHKNKINIFVGACSTGEEAYTYSMLLDKLKDKVRITAFDLSKKTIEQAKSRKILMQNLKIIPKGYYSFQAHSFEQDAFLCFDNVYAMTNEQAEYKKLFDEFFEVSSERIPKEKISLKTKLKYWYLKKFLKFIPPEYEQKYVHLKNNKALNCEFVQGDIMRLSDIKQGEKADVITFANALYHLISEDIAFGIRRPKQNAEQIMKIIAQNVKEKLNPKGLFVLGEKETKQTGDNIVVNKVLKESGFVPLNETEKHNGNIWQLK